MKAERKNATVSQVARLAGVSPATVSRVAKGSAYVDAEIEARVREAASRLGLDLLRNRPRVIGMILSNREILHPYHSHILTGAEAYCAAHDYSVLFLTFRYDAGVPWQKLNLPRVLQRRDLLSGLIVAGTNSPNLLDLLSRKRIPFAVLGDNVLGGWEPDKYDVVWSDDVQGADEMTRYLQSLGHRDIWFIGTRRLSWFARRYSGYAKAMEDAGLRARLSEFDRVSVQEIGYLATKSIFAGGEAVTAIFAAGDLVAEGVYEALRDRGLRVPEDISVAGFNDIEGAVMHPPLTTVRQFPDQVGTQLAKLIVERVKRPDLAPQQFTIPTQIIKRESCRAPAAPVLEPIHSGSGTAKLF
jgi:DNA-binding LacI/PurR family transcriptional regulator